MHSGKVVPRSHARRVQGYVVRWEVREGARSSHTCIKPDQQAGVIMRWAISSWIWVRRGQGGRKQSRGPVLGPDVHGVKKGGRERSTEFLDQIPAGSQGSQEVKAEACVPGLKCEIWVLGGWLQLGPTSYGKEAAYMLPVSDWDWWKKLGGAEC